MKCSVFIGTSLDGFIARENGDLDWLPEGEEVEDHGYNAFIADIDVVVMGRGTYDKVLTFGVWPFDRQVVVLTSRPLERPSQVPDTVEAMSATPSECVARLAARGFRHAYVDGGRTIQAFLEAGLIQRMIITRIPVLIGRGIPLFGPLSRDVRLRHVETRSFPSGLVQSEYRVVEADVP